MHTRPDRTNRLALAGTFPMVSRRLWSRRGVLRATAALGGALAGGCAAGGTQQAPKRGATRSRRLAFAFSLAPFESLDEALRRVRMAGANVALLPASGLRGDGRSLASVRFAEARNALAATGVRALGIHSPLSLPLAIGLCEANPRGRDAALHGLRDALDLCAGLGGQVVALGGDLQRAAEQDSAPDQAWARLAEALPIAAGWAAERKLALVLDLPTESPNRAGAVLATLGPVANARPGLRLAVNGPTLLEDDRLARLLKEQPRTVGLVRLSGSISTAEGTGRADLARVLGLLDEAAYDGWLCADLGGPATAASALTAAVRAI